MRLHSILICLSTVLSFGTSAVADLPTAPELLNRIREREERYATRHSVAKWTDGPIEEATTWSVATVTQHADGRIRHALESFVLDAEGNAVPAERTNDIQTYNGTITVSQNWQRLLNEHGQPLTEEQIAQGHPGYHSALLWDGLFDDPHKMRSPWGLCQYGLTYGLEECIAAGRSLVVEEITPGTQHYRVTFERGETPDDMVRYVAEIDGDRDWTVSRIAGYRGEVQIRDEVTTFQQNEQGYWAPVSGHTQIFPPSGGSPILDWRFEVIEFKAGEEAVDEDSFAIVLQPNSSVYDVRHQIGYHTPAETLTDPDFDLFALEALLNKLESEIDSQ
jgi:hypothetical protein